MHHESVEKNFEFFKLEKISSRNFNSTSAFISANDLFIFSIRQTKKIKNKKLKRMQDVFIPPDEAAAATNFEELPSEICLKIFQHLKTRDILNLRSTNKI